MAAKKKSPVNPKLIVAVIVVLLIGVGAYLFVNKGSNDPVSQGSNAITSIRDALSKSVSLECDYTDASTDVAAKAYIKNGAVRVDSTSSDPSQSGSIILKDKKMYMWNGQEGFVMTIPDVTPMEGEQTTTPSQSEDLIKDLEQYKDKCKASIVSDSLFTPPTDVTFSDMSQMMEGMPGGAQPQMTEEDMMKMMEQYNTQ